MGKNTVIDVQFDNNPEGIVEAGQTVQGTVIVTLNEKRRSEGIKLNFTGEANVRWTKGSGEDEVKFKEKQKYQEDEIVIKDHAGDPQEMPAGTYTFPFCFQLKENLPASFNYTDDDIKANVTYCIVVTFMKSLLDSYFTKPITVTRGLDLNVEQYEAMKERRHVDDMFVCCFCCRSGPVTASVHVPRVGYIPGDSVAVNGEIENLSSKTVRSDVALIRKYAFEADHGTYDVYETLQLIKGQDVRPGAKHTCRETLTIPMGAQPSFLVGCGLIDILYYAEVRADPFLKVPVDIVVGSIPHAAVAQEAGTAFGFSTDAPSAFSSSGLTQGAQEGGKGHDKAAISTRI